LRATKSYRFGPLWVDHAPYKIRLGVFKHQLVSVRDIRKRPWTPSFSERNGYGRLTIVFWRWKVEL